MPGRRHAWSLSLLGALVGCAGGGVNFVRTPAVGRAETCPDGAAAVDDRLGYDPNSVRCSYADAIGHGVTTLSGQVRADDGGVGVGVDGVVVTIHALDGPAKPQAPGPVLGHATTDMQGSFRFSVVLESGDYLVLARDERGSQTLAFAPLTLEDAPRREVSDLLLLLPVDERLKQTGEGAESSTPLTSPSEPR